MRKTDVTFGQLDKVLRAYGFSSQPGNATPPGHIYHHEVAGAVIMLPAYRKNQKIYEHHLVAARIELDNFGIADPATFDAKIKKAS